MEREFYIVYRIKGERQQHTERVGRSSKFTEGQCNLIRAKKQEGQAPTKQKKRQAEKEKSLKGNGPLTISRLWEIYKKAHLNNSSIRQDICRYDLHIKSCLGNREAETIRTGDIESLLKKIEGKGLSAQTIKHVLALLRRLLRYGQSLGLFVMSPALVFRLPQVDNLKTEYMTDTQLAAYLKALDAEADQDKAAFLKIALLTGARKGALLALQWDDIDFEHGLIRLRGEYSKNGKTSYIPLADEARKVFQSITRTDSPFIWPGKDGGKRDDFRRVARRVKRVAGLPESFRPCHGLRHAYASSLASSGEVDIYTLQKLLTHGSPTMTQRYAHLADETLMKAAIVAEKALSPKQEAD